MRYDIVPTAPDHLAHVAAHMRQADRDEVAATVGLDPLEALEWSVSMGESWTGMADDEPICIFGVVPKSMLSSAGIPWLLGTDAIERHARAFLVRSRHVVANWKARFNLMENYVDARNTKSIEWLRWLGFTIHQPEPHGIARLPFHHFTMRRPDDV